MEDLKTCSKCKERLTIDRFSCSKRNKDGDCIQLNSWCNVCRTNGNRERLGFKKRKKGLVTDSEKLCLKCNIMKPHSNFSKSIRGTGGLAAYCKKCHPRVGKEKARLNTQRWRDQNRNRWRGSHRINMLRRRNNLVVSQDNSITDDYLEFLYSQETCCWCGRSIEEKDRTLEHIVELSSGGHHSVHNTNMACRSCNSSRLNKDGNNPVQSLYEKYLRSKDDNHS